MRPPRPARAPVAHRDRRARRPPAARRPRRGPPNTAPTWERVRGPARPRVRRPQPPRPRDEPPAPNAIASAWAAPDSYGGLPRPRPPARRPRSDALAHEDPET